MWCGVLRGAVLMGLVVSPIAAEAKPRVLRTPPASDAEEASPPLLPPPPDDGGIAWHIGVPFSFGHGEYWTRAGHSKGLWLRFRAVATVGPEHGPTNYNVPEERNDTWAVGPYYEVGWHPIDGGKRFSMGAGGNGILWISRIYALMPSLGWYMQDHASGAPEHGIGAGLFLGGAFREFSVFAFFTGLRLEGRIGLGSQRERALLFAGEVDSFVAVGIPVAMYALLSSDGLWGHR